MVTCIVSIGQATVADLGGALGPEAPPSKIY